jgi:succinate-semialdehyde dehydrogenase/glutarate-semialdehyde dehydrogenase
MSIQTINPFNNEVAKTFEEMSPVEIKIAISIADEAFQSWKKTTFMERSDLLYMVAKLMRAQKHELSKLITLEMGKLLVQSYGEIELSADIIEYYARNAESFLEDEALVLNYGEAYVKSTPIGMLLGVEPWNFPFYQVARFAAPNIMAGNVVLIKHASNVPQCALIFF